MKTFSTSSRQPGAVRGHQAEGVLALGSGSPSASSTHASQSPALLVVRNGNRAPAKKPIQRRRPTRPGTRFNLPRKTQLAALRLPEVTDWLTARERQIILEVAIDLIDGGVSLNKSARLLHVAQSWLSVMLPRYRREGFVVLLPQRRGKTGRAPKPGHRRRPAPCVLHLPLLP